MCYQNNWLDLCENDDSLVFYIPVAFDNLFAQILVFVSNHRI